MLGTHHLNLLFDFLKELHYWRTGDKIYQGTLTRASEYCKAEAGTFFAIEGNRLLPMACEGLSVKTLQEVPFEVGKGVCGWVAEKNQSILVDQAERDSRFNRWVDVVSGFKTRSILCVPVTLRDACLGVLELLNCKEGKFFPVHLELVEAMMKQVSIALDNARLDEETTRLYNFNNAILNNLNGGFIAVDLEGKITHFNPSAGRILDIYPMDVLGTKIDMLSLSLAPFRALLETTLKRQVVVTREEMEINHRNNMALKIGYSTLLIKDPQTGVRGAGVIFQDITHL